MNIPQDLRYSKSHEWVKVDGETATIGITAYAQDQLGDIVFIELPPVGRDLAASTEFGSIESVKSVSELISPLTGTVTAINEEVVKKPEVINTDPFIKGWMIKIKATVLTELDGLMTAEKYKEFVEEIS
jgi:glycine cleavage system H protein